MCSSRLSIDTNDGRQLNFTVEARHIPASAIRKDVIVSNTGRSEVWKCFMTLSKQSENLCVAVKSISIRNPSAEEVEKANKTIFHRASIWIQLRHDNILRLEGVISEDFGPLLALVSPWMKNGSLDDYMKQEGNLSTDKILFVLREVAAGLQYLHNNGIYNGLNPADVLIGGDGKPYLRGFGVWMIIAGSEATTFHSEHGDKYRWMAHKGFLQEGEKDWSAEIAEVYSYGCIMTMLFSGHQPYHWVLKPKSFMKAWFRGKEPFKQFGGLDYDRKLKQFAKQCLSNSNERPSLSRVMDLLSWRIDFSGMVKNTLSKLSVNQIPNAALSTCDSDDRGSVSGLLKCNWLHALGTTVVAVKILDVGNLNDLENICDGIRREVYVRKRLRRDIILSLYGMTTGFGILPSFVYPWMAHGSLHDYLRREFSTLSPLQKSDILYQVADAIRYLHKNDIAHGNLTGDNVLVDGAGWIRIADFSRSVILGDAEDWKSSSQLPGAARYVSPESVVRDEQTEPPQPTKASDVYSYGCIMILVLSGKVPYWWISEESEVLSAKVQGTEPFLPTVEIDPAPLDLVRCCLSMPIKSRPSIQKVLYLFLVQRFGALDLTSSVQRLNKHHQVAGGFPHIHKCTLHPSMSTPVHVAVKEVMLLSGDLDMLKIMKRWFREIQIWMRLKHENIVPLWGVTDDFGSVPALVSPWFENGALTGYLQHEHKTLSYRQKFALLRDVACGLQYLHSQSIVHGDLSGNNVLVDNNGKASLSDFGLSALLHEKMSDTLLPTHPGGAIPYIAPEYLISLDEDNISLIYSSASDIYSFGGIMLQVMEGKVPYHYITRYQRIISLILRGVTPERPLTCDISDTEWDFIQRCWSREKEHRPLDAEIITFVEQRAAIQS